MAKIIFLGGEETGDVGSVAWGKYKFELNKAVDCTDKHIVMKASKNQFFKVEDADEKTEMPSLSPAAKAIGTLSEKK